MPELLKPTARDLESLVPHAGSMVLLDEVIAHDLEQIHCRARINPGADHPLAREGRLPATALAEYGAQAMAVHGGLLKPAGQPPRAGRLVALGQLDLAVAEITQATTLEVHATRLGSNPGGQMYRFEILSGDTWLARGQATVMFAD